jgi:hypothetical protein
MCVHIFIPYIALCRKIFCKGLIPQPWSSTKDLKKGNNHLFKSNSKPEEANGFNPGDLKRVSR